MAYTYSTFVDALKTALQRTAPNTDFTNYLPTIIDQAEQKCYRDLDLLATVIKNTAGTTTPNQRLHTLSQISGYYVVLLAVNIINGTSRTRVIKCSQTVLDMLWPDDTAPSGGSIPDKWAPLTDQIIQFGPSPGSALTVELIGEVRPTPLSASNTSTFLSAQLPDLFFAAAMMAGTAYNQDWGAEKDDPKMAMSWSDEYAKLVGSAQGEETRRKYQAFASV